MRLLVFFLLNILSLNSFASHCLKPSQLPPKVKEFAIAHLSSICSVAADEENVLVQSWKFSSWDTEESYTLRLENTKGGMDSRGYSVQMTLTGDCRQQTELELKELIIFSGCF